MTTTTFKLMLPTGECRRATFHGVPDKATLDFVTGADRDHAPTFVYRDSEGDKVLIKDSNDVTEAVRDARKSGTQCIKLYLQKGRSRCGAQAQSGTTTACARPRPKCGTPQWVFRGRPTPWAFARPTRRNPFHYVKLGLDSNEWSHIMQDVDTVLDSLFGSFAGEEEAATTTVEQGQSTDDHVDEKQQPSAGDASAMSAEAGETDNTTVDGEGKAQESIIVQKEEDEDATTTENITVEDAAPEEKTNDTSPVPTDEATAPEATFIVVEPEKAKVESEETTAANAGEDPAIIAKVQLLAEMGFDLPADIATNMIKELGGRMDLIVRALVANGK